jgi:hypothetical protein
MMQRFKLYGLILVAVTSWSLRAVAQNASAEVNGTVADPNGAIIQGAVVVLTNQETQIVAKRLTNSTGEFIFIDVQPGQYLLTVSARGFKTASLEPFSLSVNQTFEQAIKLEVGSTTETVEVNSTSAELLQRSSSELGTVIQEDVVQDMPLNGRNFTELLTLTPGATPVSTAQGSGVSTQDAGMSAVPGSTLAKPAMHGQQNRSTLYYLDGVTNTDLRGPVYGVLPMLDATSQFKVQAHNEKVEFGGVVGGVVNMVSRSGTNIFHGSAFEFVRNNYFDARDPFKDVTNSGPAPFHQNQFGATIGGPIWRDHTFFFGSYEGWRYSKPTQAFTYVPTQAELSGDFTNTITPTFLIYNPYSTTSPSSGKYNRAQFTCDSAGRPIIPNTNGTQTGGTPCMKIPSQLFDPTISKLLSTFLLPPNYNGAIIPGQTGTNFEENRPNIDNNNEFQVKVDHRISSRDSIWIRFTNMYVFDNNPVTGTIEYAPSNYHAYDWGVGYVRVLSPHIIYDAQAGLLLKPYDFNTNTVPTGAQAITALGVPGADQWGGLFTALASPYLTSNIGVSGDAIRKNPTWSASTDLSFLLGKHNAKVGLQFTNVQRVQENTYQQFSFNTTVTENPNAGATSGNILASAMLGLPSGYNGFLPSYGEDNFSLQMWSGFIQDEWRALPRLTVEIGLRYDFLTVPKILNGRPSGILDLTKQTYTIGAASIPDCKNAQQNPCIPGGGFASVPHNTNILYAGSNKSFLAPTSSLFEPRIGLAYSIHDDLVIRGGVGLFFDALPARSQYAQNQLDAGYWPWATGFTGNANSVGVPSTITHFNQLVGNFTSPVTPSSPWGIGGYYNSPNFKPGYSYQWNLELQQQFGKYTSLSVAYVGSTNGNADYTGYANAAPFASPSGTSRTTVDNYRAIPWMISSLHWGAPIGRSNYNALETRIMRQATRGLRMILSYTWGKSIDDTSGYFGAENGIGGGAAVQNYWDPRSNRSVSSYDIPHFVSAATLWELPVGHGKTYLNHGWEAYVLGDWQANGLLQARSGQVYNLDVTGDIANIEGSLNSISGYGRPNLIGNPIPQHQSTAEWFNPAAFNIPCTAATSTTPAIPCSFGSFSRNVLRGGRVWGTDFSMFKLIPIHERYNMQLRFEAFNVFNVQSLAPPGQGNSNQVQIGIAGAGGISAVALNPRQLQFGARVTF